MTAEILRPDRAAYVRAHAWMAALAMAGGMAFLWLLGSPHVWTGAIGGLAAIGVRGWYMASEELSVVWTLTETRLDGPGWRKMALADVETVRSFGGAVQVVTAQRDKHLLRYLADPARAKSRILAARDAASSGQTSA